MGSCILPPLFQIGFKFCTKTQKQQNLKFVHSVNNYIYSVPSTVLGTGNGDRVEPKTGMGMSTWSLPSSGGKFKIKDTKSGGIKVGMQSMP